MPSRMFFLPTSVVVFVLPAAPTLGFYCACFLKYIYIPIEIVYREASFKQTQLLEQELDRAQTEQIREKIGRKYTS